ncbi:hypothetical protein E2320_000709 [Naja naja]|nr:hypothetical protein E2320_000709 [Naja naja]
MCKASRLCRSALAGQGGKRPNTNQKGREASDHRMARSAQPSGRLSEWGAGGTKRHPAHLETGWKNKGCDHIPGTQRAAEVRREGGGVVSANTRACKGGAKEGEQPPVHLKGPAAPLHSPQPDSNTPNLDVFHLDVLKVNTSICWVDLNGLHHRDGLHNGHRVAIDGFARDHRGGGCCCCSGGCRSCCCCASKR